MPAPILFDGTVLDDGPWTGVARSFFTTLCAYTRLAEAPLCVAALRNAPRPHGLPATCEWLPTLPARGVARRRGLRDLARQLDPTLLHAPVSALPRFLPCPALATVHDIPWQLPELRTEPGAGLRHRLALGRARRQARMILVPSEHTAAALAREGRVKGQLRVVPHAIDAPLDPATTAPPAHDGPFLVLGDDRPRKNLDRVLRAHDAARRQDPSLPPLRRLGPGSDWVCEDTKWSVLRRSRGLLHVALHEGFGLPVLEGMAAGTPVLTSNSSCMPEIAGDATLLCDPRDEEAIRAAILRLHRDEALRETLVERGRTRVRDFSPARSAAGWLAAHRECGA